MSKAPATVIVNGQSMPANQAHWPASLPHGLRFGDGCFETMAMRNGKITLWDYHWRRLSHAATLLDFTLPTEQTVTNAINNIASNNACTDAIIRLQCSLAGQSTGYLPNQPPQAADWLLELKPLPKKSPSLTLQLTQWRTIPPICLPTELKTMQGMHARLARCAANSAQAGQPLRLSIENHLSEAGTGNLFILVDDILLTPHLGTGAVAGVMRAFIMDNSPTEEGYYSLDILENAQAVWVTNAVQGMIPVQHLQPQNWSWPSQPAKAAAIQTHIEGLLARDLA